MGLDLHGTAFAAEPVTVAAPRPVLRLFHETALDGIAMHVLEFFDELGLGEDVEVIVAGLPEFRAGAFQEF